MTTLDDKMKQAAQEHGKGGGGDFFKFAKSGTYRLRILSDVEAIATHFFGKGKSSSVCYGEKKGCPFHDAEHDEPSVKFICYLLDRSDDVVKLGELPWSVVSALSNYQKDDELAFSEYPMPYDIKVTVNKESKDPKGIYSVLPGQARTPLSEKNSSDLSGALGRMPVSAFVQKRKDSTMEKHQEEGIWLSPEQLAEKEQERKEKAAEIAAKDPSAVGDVSREYPTEDINPDDIPF